MENSKSNSAVRDLIQINNDRITGYEKANKELDGNRSDLSGVYLRMAEQSRKFKSELEQSYAGEPEDGNTISGSVYQAWMDVRNAFSSKKEQSTLDMCEFGEDAAQKAYAEVLDGDGISADIRQIVARQKMELRQSHDEIKALRDSEKVAH